MKKTISILLTVAILVTLFAGMTFSISAETYSGTWGDLTWSLDTETGELVISGEGEMKNFSSSSTDAWRKYKDSIKSVVINEGVTSISTHAFRVCKNLISATIPKSVTNIQNYSFTDCEKLEEIIYHPGALEWNNISKFGIWDSNCGSSTEKGSYTLVYILYFGTWGNLKWEIYTTGTLLISGEGEMENFSYSSTEAWKKHKNSIKSVVINNGVTSIGEYAFYSCSNLTNATISNSVMSIGNDAFGFCRSLKSIDIPNSVTSIGNGAFYACSSLTSIVLPTAATKICYQTFCNCSYLESITIPKSVISIESGAFANCPMYVKIIYCGTETEWNNISKADGWNDRITNRPYHELPVVIFNLEYHSVHTFNDGEIRVEATHTKEGVKDFTCTYCGAIKNELIEKLEEHEWDEGVITADPTYDCEGVKTYTCECGETKTKAIAKLERPATTTAVATATPTTSEKDSHATSANNITTSAQTNEIIVGCSSSITLGAGFAILAAGAAAITVCRKKED